MSKVMFCSKLAALLVILFVFGCSPKQEETVRISADVMRDKIKGGWVGQTIGVTYGAPTEFRWPGSWIQEYVPIEVSEKNLVRYFNNDDLYMDLSFLAVLDSLGLDAPVDAMALKFAHAGFSLWHANQAGRWNILHGIMPPASGYWKNNPHADDIDFQIEADFIGLLCPGMPVTALGYCDKVGHIMNYGDGVYGGVFVASAYTHAYVESDIVTVVEKALQSLPPASGYARCIADVIEWWRAYPDDWHRCWFEVQKKWSEDVGCPECALQPGNIDAKLNGAYIAIGLLYGNGDFGKTTEISTRCGQDSDCNPSNAAGILGTLLGFEKIPEPWKRGLEKIEDQKLNYCNYSLKDVYEVNYRLAAELVRRGGGKVDGDTWVIKRQKPIAPEKAEIGFEGLTPVRIENLDRQDLEDTFSATFEGRAFVVEGGMYETSGEALCEVRVDGKMIESVTLVSDYHDRRTPLFWYYDLGDGSHLLEIKKVGGDGVPRLNSLLIYQ
ncbi:MAG TPA: ADP-ribosylglycohydrolase family protein [archaeon]|nr:ADP-ribosylglycohydrolase family protein [archaeon]